MLFFVRIADNCTEMRIYPKIGLTVIDQMVYST